MKIIFESSSFAVSTTLSRKNTPRIDGVFFQSMKDKILGKGYSLSLVFIGKKRMRQLNHQYRKKDYATDILSFTLDTDAGEICIYPEKARRKATLFERTYENYLSFLFIHGMLHLKGMDHESDSDAAKMEGAEKKWCKAFGI
jgi:probable rRNA maturation factor